MNSEEVKNEEVEILLIEDSIFDAELAIRSLRKNNVSNKIVHLKDGAAALEFIFGVGDFEGRDIMMKPKVILLDLKMPRVNGLEVLEKVKADVRTKSIPVVILTSSKEDPDIKKSYALGANSYIVKPVDFDGFHKVVSELGLYWVLHNQTPS
jgi:two-component system, response regulator